jgi:hypothetical protein
MFNNKLFLVVFIFWFAACHQIKGQKTTIRGFVAVDASLQNDEVSFGFGEQDLFITSEITDNIFFLGETVFKFADESSTDFNISVERIVIRYNYKGNHNILIGKHHTPVNYWNDSYHHGRVFFPTIERPLLFAAHIIPIHTTGIGFQGLNLGKMRFGYNLMIGNGLGSSDIQDNDKYKSVTASIHIKPADRLQVGFSFYNDIISAGSEVHDSNFIATENINQQLYTGTVAYFGSRYELLAESTLTNNKSDSMGSTNAFISYLYAGYKIKEKWIPYIRFDHLNYDNNDVYYNANNTTSIIAGLRYEISYLAVVKLEFQHANTDLLGSVNKVTAQLAIGF